MANHQNEAPTLEPAERITLEIQGMNCASCARTVERALADAPGVAEAYVNFATEKASVVPTTEMAGVETLTEAVRKAGYGAIPEKIEPSRSEVSEDQQEAAMGGISGPPAGDPVADATRRKARDLILAAAFTLPLGILTVGTMLGMPLPEAISPGTNPLRYGFLQALLLLPVLFAGRRFFGSGARALWSLRPNMDSLIALGTLAAAAYSMYGLGRIFMGDVNYVHQLYIKSAAFILTLVLLGKYLEARAKRSTTGAIRALLKLVPETTFRVEAGGPREIPIAQIRKDDVLLIKPGARVPADGILSEGATQVDESMLTGESMPREKSEGDKLIAGTINGTGSVRMRVESIGRETVLARVIKLVEDAQATRAPIASLADRISAYFVPAVIAAASLSALAWFIAGQPVDFALTIFISVLIIACPCALGLAVPAAIMTGTGRGAGMGILIRNAAALEIARKVDVILFDKTGTLTLGEPRLMEYRALNNSERPRNLEFAAAVEAGSEHPIARAILRGADDENITRGSAVDVRALPGFGVSGKYQDREIVLGKSDVFADASRQEAKEEARQTALEGVAAGQEFAARGMTPVFMTVDGEPMAVFAVADAVKPGAKDAVARLRKMNIEPVMLTGDREPAARNIAREVGIENVLAEVSPEDKAREVERLRGEGRVVAMAGDGINDAPALAAADLGMVMSAGSDAALESGDIVLVGGDLGAVARAVRLSRASTAIIKQNLFWAFFYNVLFIPVAAGALTFVGGPLLKPAFAAAAMAFSSVSVLLNALRLRTMSID